MSRVEVRLSSGVLVVHLASLARWHIKSVQRTATAAGKTRVGSSSDRTVQCVPGVAKAFVQGKTCRSVQERAGSRDGGQLKHAISATRFLPRIAEAVKSRQSTQCLRPTVRQLRPCAPSNGARRSDSPCVKSR